MKKAISLICVLIGLLLASTHNSRSALASEAFPFESGTTIRIIVPYSPGGGFDANARLAAPFLEEKLNQIGGKNIKVVVENVTGGAGSIATTQVFMGKPDGKTILHLDPESSLWLQVLKDVKYDVSKFTCLAQQSQAAPGFVVQKALGINDFDALVKRSQQKSILIGTSGHGNSDHIFVLLFQLFLKDKGINLNMDFIHLHGTGQIIASMRRKEVEGTMETIHGLLAAEKEGFAKFLFTLTHERLADAKHVPAFPEVVNVKKEELTDLLNSVTYRRFYALPPGADEKVVNVLDEAFRQALTDERFLEKAKKIKRPMTYKNAKEATEILQSEWRLASQFKDQIVQLLEK
jgi:tripartite-type tricarboxylate transporter receptor subunit TctC